MLNISGRSIKLIIEKDIFGKTIKFVSQSIQDDAVFLKGKLYDSDLIKKAKEVMDTFTDEDRFIDAGAHVGIFSLMLGKGRAYAFEPDIVNFMYLVQNIQLNKVNVIPIHEALFCTEENYEIEKGQHSGLCKLNFSGGIKQTKVLDKLHFEGNIKLIKIDVEGLDMQVLLGAIKLIDKFRPFIIIEMTENQKDIVEFLDRKNYKLEAISNNLFCSP